MGIDSFTWSPSRPCTRPIASRPHTSDSSRRSSYASGGDMHPLLPRIVFDVPPASGPCRAAGVGSPLGDREYPPAAAGIQRGVQTKQVLEFQMVQACLPHAVVLCSEIGATWSRTNFIDFCSTGSGGRLKLTPLSCAEKTLDGLEFGCLTSPNSLLKHQFPDTSSP